MSISNALTHPQLERRHEQMKRNLEAQYKELEEKRRVFEDEKSNWEAQQRILEQQKLDASKSVTLTSMSRKVRSGRQQTLLNETYDISAFI